MSEIKFSEPGSIALVRKRLALSDRAFFAMLMTALVLNQTAWFAAVGYGLWLLIDSS